MAAQGGGCVESALSIYLENFATTLGSREQLAIAEFAEAMLEIPNFSSVLLGLYLKLTLSVEVILNIDMFS